MWLALALIAFSGSVALVLVVVQVAVACVRVLRDDLHDVFSPTPGSNDRPTPRG